MPVNTLNYWAATLTVPTVATSLWSLAKTYFAANRSTDSIDQSATVMFMTGEVGNGATVIYVGDKTLNVTATPPVGVGLELTAGASAWSGQSMSGGMTTDLNNFFVQAATTVTPYLCVLVMK